MGKKNCELDFFRKKEKNGENQDQDGINLLRDNDLKLELRERMLGVTGNKSILRARLINFITNEEDDTLLEDTEDDMAYKNIEEEEDKEHAEDL